MSEAKHTPGPWRLGGDGIYGQSRLVGGDEVRQCVCHIGAAGIYRNDRNAELLECDANARLIAAAPELLEACKAAKKLLEPDLIEPGRRVFWKLVAAIAKAEGNKPI